MKVIIWSRRRQVGEVGWCSLWLVMIMVGVKNIILPKTIETLKCPNHRIYNSYKNKTPSKLKFMNNYHSLVNQLNQ